MPCQCVTLRFFFVFCFFCPSASFSSSTLLSFFSFYRFLCFTYLFTVFNIYSSNFCLLLFFPFLISYLPLCSSWFHSSYSTSWRTDLKRTVWESLLYRTVNNPKWTVLIKTSKNRKRMRPPPKKKDGTLFGMDQSWRRAGADMDRMYRALPWLMLHRLMYPLCKKMWK